MTNEVSQKWFSSFVDFNYTLELNIENLNVKTELLALFLKLFGLTQWKNTMINKPYVLSIGECWVLKR